MFGVRRGDDPLARASSSRGALSVVNYRRFFVGQSLSNIGTWFQTLAQALLVLKIAGRASALGEVVALQTFPMLVFGPLVGGWMDRANLRLLMITVAVFSGCEAAALSALTAAHLVTIKWIFALSLLLGFAQLFQQPSIQAFTVELVPEGMLTSAYSLNGVIQGVGRLAGPALGTLIYVWRGPAASFALNALSYLVVSLMLCSLRRRELRPRRRLAKGATGFRDSLRFSWHAPVRAQLIANAAVGTFAFNFPIFFASFTQLVLRSGAASFGIAEATNAVSAVVFGSLLARRLRSPTRRTYSLACLGLGAALGVAAGAPDLVVFLFAMLLFGATLVAYNAVNQSVLQRSTPSDRIGTVMTLSAYGTSGTSPIGALIAGWLTVAGTARAAIGVGAFSLFLVALILVALDRRALRPSGELVP